MGEFDARQLTQQRSTECRGAMRNRKWLSEVKTSKFDAGKRLNASEKSNRGKGSAVRGKRTGEEKRPDEES